MKNAFYSNTVDQYEEGKKLFFHATDEAWFELHRIIPQRSALANAMSHLYKHFLTTIKPLNLQDNDPSNELRIIQHIYSLVPGSPLPSTGGAGHIPDDGQPAKRASLETPRTPSQPDGTSGQAEKSKRGDRGAPSQGQQGKR